MSYIHSTPSRETDHHALPNVEVFRAYQYECGNCGEIIYGMPDYYGIVAQVACACGAAKNTLLPSPLGWYWQACFPGCMPDGEPNGPFDTEAEAIADAQDSDEGDSLPNDCLECSRSYGPHYTGACEHGEVTK